MKKSFLIIAAIAALVFNSCACGGDKKDCNTTQEGDSIEAQAGDDAITDVTKLGEDLSAALESADAAGLQGKIDAAKEYAKKLLDEGKGEEAKGIIEKVQAFLSENAEKVTSVVGDNAYVQGALDWVKSVNAGELIDKAGELVGAETEAVKDAAADKVEDVKDAAAEKVEEVKDAAAEKVEAVKDAAKDAKDAAVEKGNEAIEAAKEKVKDAANKAVEDATNEAINKVGDLLK